jgi:hypothetical protein
LTVPRDHLAAGLPIEVTNFRCPTCGPTTVTCDDYAVNSPLDGGGVQPLSGTCNLCRRGVDFFTEVSPRSIRIPAGPLSGQGKPRGDDEPIIPE